jgi:hypothetical protein
VVTLLSSFAVHRDSEAFELVMKNPKAVRYLGLTDLQMVYAAIQKTTLDGQKEMQLLANYYLSHHIDLEVKGSDWNMLFIDAMEYKNYDVVVALLVSDASRKSLSKRVLIESLQRYQKQLESHDPGTPQLLVKLTDPEIWPKVQSILGSAIDWPTLFISSISVDHRSNTLAVRIANDPTLYKTLVNPEKRVDSSLHWTDKRPHFHPLFAPVPYLKSQMQKRPALPGAKQVRTVLGQANRLLF